MLDLEVLQVHELRVVPPRQRLGARALIHTHLRQRNCDRNICHDCMTLLGAQLLVVAPKIS
jgi:hypothetical protein